VQAEGPLVPTVFHMTPDFRQHLTDIRILLSRHGRLDWQMTGRWPISKFWRVWDRLRQILEWENPDPET